ncbi:hypothetical protein ABIE45_004414 [Methylobacterium sp. OAE515]|uniref:hypothetical protein n=1 Tax=Methylobacterium sp. OAE515 TaxID=2817895 RepID=UPI00178AA7E5
MIDFPQILFGVPVPWLQTAILNYWIVAVGVIALFFFGSYHFNTPNYALSGGSERAAGPSTLDPAISRINGLAPPKYTTTRSQYQRFMLKYVIMLETAFVVMTFSPEVIKSIYYLSGASVPTGQIHFPETVTERAIWSLFILTGLLTSFPVFRQVDGFILRALHKGANVPTGVEQTAQYLLIVKYEPNQTIGSDIFTGIRTHHFREVIAEREAGSLERTWFELRCIRESVKKYVLNCPIPLLQSIIQSDIDDAGQRVDNLRDQLFKYFQQQDKILPDHVENIDDYLMSQIDKPGIQEFAAQRRAFLAEVQALKLRFCRLCTLAVFAVEQRPERIDMRLKNLGFGVEVTYLPRWHWEAIFIVGLCVILSTLIPSFIYAVTIDNFGFNVPAQYRTYVPVDPKQVVMWALMAAALHTLAVVVALAVKRFYAPKHARGGSSEAPENEICAAVSYMICLTIQVAFVMMSGNPARIALAWALLPAITGYFTGKYIDKSRLKRPLSHLRSWKQAGVTGAASFLASIVTLVHGFQIAAIHPIVYIFILYATVVAAAIGFAIGESFQRTYSHSKWTEDPAVNPDILGRSDRKVIGDLIIQRLAEPATQNARLNLAQGAGI